MQNLYDIVVALDVEINNQNYLIVSFHLVLCVLFVHGLNLHNYVWWEMVVMETNLSLKQTREKGKGQQPESSKWDNIKMLKKCCKNNQLYLLQKEMNIGRFTRNLEN